MTGEQLFNKVKSKAFCADCFLERHDENHKKVNLIAVENISMGLHVKYLLIQGLLAGNNMKEAVRNDPELQKFPEVLEKIVFFQDLAHNYDMWANLKGMKYIRKKPYQ